MQADVLSRHPGITRDTLLQSGVVARSGPLREIYERYLTTEFEKYKNRGSLCWGAGNADTAMALFIGEAPGREENKYGVPFVGPAGITLSEVLDAAGIDRFNDCLIINTETVMPPPAGYSIGKPTAKEMLQERPRVLEVVAAMASPRQRPLKVIVCLGKFAYVQLLKPQLLLAAVQTGGEPDYDKIRFGEIGGWHEDPLSFGIPVLVAYHPSYILRKMSDSPREQWFEEVNDYVATFVELRRRIHGR